MGPTGEQAQAQAQAQVQTQAQAHGSAQVAYREIDGRLLLHVHQLPRAQVGARLQLDSL